MGAHSNVHHTPFYIERQLHSHCIACTDNVSLIAGAYLFGFLQERLLHPRLNRLVALLGPAVPCFEAVAMSMTVPAKQQEAHKECREPANPRSVPQAA